MKLVEVAGKPAKAQGDVLAVAAKYKKNLKLMVENNLLLFRTSDNHSDAKLDPAMDFKWYEQTKRTTDREAQYSTESQLLANWFAETWKGAPPRARSYFATQNSEHSKRFGADSDLMLIIPADNIKAFAYSEGDFNLGDDGVQENLRNMTSLYNHVTDFLSNDEVMDMEFEIAAEVREIFTRHKVDYNKTIVNNDVVNVAQALDELMDNYYKWNRAIFKMGDKGQRPDDDLLDFDANMSVAKGDLQTMSVANWSELLQTISPQKYAKGLHLYNSLAQIKPSKLQDELWFEGSYLALGAFSRREALGNMEKLLSKL